MKKIRNNKLAAIFIFVVAITFLGTSCRNTNNPTFGKINIMADETFKPILEAELAVFHALYPNAKVNAIYTTETEALNRLFDDSIKLIFATRPLKESETKYFNSKLLQPQVTKIAVDGVALITHKENTDTILSLVTLRKLLTGEITNWKQINPKNKPGDVKVVFDNRNSSTVRFMIDSIMNGKEISNHNTAMVDNGQVLNYIQNNKDAIGVIGVAWISDKEDPKMRSFLKKLNVIAVSRDSIATADNSYYPLQYEINEGLYPLTRYIYFIKTDPTFGVATGFTNFVAGEKGQRIILKTGILPATQPVREVKIVEDL